jgi:hypothetical protein
VAQPFGSWEKGGVGQSADEVGRGGGLCAGCCTRKMLVSNRQDPGARALAPAQVTVRRELFVGVNDHAARDTKIVGQRS